jgi:uncharacterized protein DUF4331
LPPPKVLCTASRDGRRCVADKNILSVALEVPNNMLGFDPVIGVWAPVGLRRDGTLVQVDRGGHPTINPFINPDEVNNEYNLGQPAKYPNRRILTDGVFSARMAFLTNGKVRSDGIKPHDDLLPEFPYLGPPNS